MCLLNIVLMGAFIAGCASRPSPLVLWTADQNSLPERVRAAEQLIQPGWTRDQVEEALGQGNWVHRHGPVVVLTGADRKRPSAAAQEVEDWALEYKARDGCVAVLFTNSRPASANEPRFRSSGVTYRRTLKALPQDQSTSP
jgi:hypothetical protein